MAEKQRENVERLETAEALERLRDEIALKVHLAGMEARSAWEKIEPEVRHVEADLRSAAEERGGDQALLDAHLAMMEASERWERVAPFLGPIAQHLRAAGSVGAEELEARIRELRTQGATEAESDEAHEARRAQLREELEKAGNDAVNLARRAFTALKRSVDEVRRQRAEERGEAR